MILPARGLLLDAGILQGLAKEHPPHQPLTTWVTNRQRQGLRLVTLKDVMAECITVPVDVLTRLGIVVEPARTPPDPHNLLQAFSSGVRAVRFNDELKRADRAVVAHAIAGQYDVVTTDWRMRERSFREFLARMERLPDERLPNWRIPQFHLADRGIVFRTGFAA